MKTLPQVKMSSKTIFVIDDEVTISEIVQLCLADLGGWNAIAINSPLEGLQRAARDRPDAILLDLSMPIMDGFTFLEQLRKNPETQDIPVVLLSAKVKYFDSTILQKYQVVGAIAKPFDPILLADRIAQLLGWN